MEFNFTGNFQYDFGLVGYVKVLEFFGMPFKIKGNVLLVDDIVWADSFNLFYLYAFFCKFDSLRNKIYDELYKSEGINFTKEQIDALIPDKEKVIALIEASASISDIDLFLTKLTSLFYTRNDMNVEKLKLVLARYPFLSIINQLHQNSVPTVINTIDKALEIYKRFSDYFSPESEGLESCYFCGRPANTAINKQNYFYAPSQINNSWLGKPEMFICNSCRALNLFTMYAIPVINGTKGYAVYSSNLLDCINANNELRMITADKKDNVLKVFLEKADFSAPRQFISIVFNHQEPSLDIKNIFSKTSAFFKNHSDILQEIDDNVISEVIERVSENTSLDGLINEFLGLSIGRKASYLALQTLKALIKTKLYMEGKNMEDFAEFDEFGKRIRTIIYARHYGNAGTIKNKIVNFVSNIRDSLIVSRTKFMEAVMQIAIWADISLDPQMTAKISDERVDYKEAGMVLILGMMSKKEKEEEEKEEVVA